MRRSRLPVLLLVILLLGVLFLGGLAACGDGAAVVPTAAQLRSEGEAFAKQGRWVDAAERYRLAYAQVDPLPDRAKARAELALLRGRALSRAGYGALAVQWVTRSLTLDPTRYDLHYEIATLHDGTHPDLVDEVVAAEAYRQFLEAWEAAGAPAAFEGLATHAGNRLAALR